VKFRNSSYICKLKHDHFFTSHRASPDWIVDVDGRVQYGINFGKTRGFIHSGDPIIVITGWKKEAGYTKTMRVLYVDIEW
jgi:hypothetical protein